MKIGDMVGIFGIMTRVDRVKSTKEKFWFFGGFLFF